MLGLSFIAPVAIFIMNSLLVFKLVGMIYPDYGTYALFIRNRLIDIGMISVPWLFYFSHPMFHDRSGRVSSNT
uniref:Serpentine receptor class gamma n=1 Tax=Caenorhabditis tropicalis TaxID=1561998 RepID=A0A1I7T3E9_9PELO